MTPDALRRLAPFRLQIRTVRVEYEVDYGIDCRCGWSITVDGSVVSQFRSDLDDAVEEARLAVLRWDALRENRHALADEVRDVAKTALDVVRAVLARSSPPLPKEP